MGKCFICGKESAFLHNHHISWKPEKTVPVCRSCHQGIHSGKKSVRMHSPVRGVRSKSYKKNRQPSLTKFGITDDAFLPKMIEQCDNDRERGLIYVLYYTGMHGSILRTLSLDNLVQEGDNYYIRWRRTKTDKQMEAPVPSDRLPYIREFLDRRKHSLQWTNLLLRDIGKRAGFDAVSTMTFRHTRCIRLIRQRVPLSVIAEVMGCTVDVVIRNYGKLTETQRRDLIEEGV